MERRHQGLGAVWPALPFAAIFPALMGLIAVYVSSLPRPDPRMSASLLFVAGAAIILVLHSVMVHRVAPRVGVAAALSAMVWAVPMAFGDADALGWRITDVMGAGPEPDTSPFLILFAVVVVVGGAFGLTALGSYRARDRAVYRTAWGATALGAIVVVLALVKSGRPDPDTYLDSLLPDATLEEGDVRCIGDREVRYERVPKIIENESYIECRLSGVSGAPPISDRLELPNRPRSTEACPSIRFLVDRRGDLAFVTREDHPPWMFPPTVAFRVSDGVALRVSAPVLADRIAAPRGWRIDGVGSVVFAHLLLGVAWRLRRRAASLIGRDAHHQGEGWVTFADQPAMRVPVAASLRRGAIVLFGEQQRRATYREAPVLGFRGAAPGSVADRRTLFLDVAANLTAIALAVAVLGVTPLVVARFYCI